MKVIITGSKGFVGTNLKNHRESLGDEVIEFNSGYSLDYLRYKKADILFHCAAELQNESKMFESNIRLTFDLLNLFKEGISDKFVYIGTSSEYGRKNVSIMEGDNLNPETLYAATKSCGAILCDTYAKLTKKQILIARPFSLYGSYQSSSKFIPTLFSCYKNKTVAKVDVNAVHDWICIEDFIRGLNLFVTKKPLLSNTLNFGSGRQYSNKQIFDIFCDVVGSKIEIEKVEGLRPYDSSTWVCDTSKAKSIIGFKCEYDIYKGLEKYIAFMEKRAEDSWASSISTI